MPNQEAINRFLETHGQRAVRVISVLAKKSKFKEAIESEIGQELMNDVLVNMENILDKIINEEASETEKAEFRAYREIANKWQDRLAAYNKAVLQIATNKIGS